MFRQLGAGPVDRWLNVELPMVQNPRVDLLGETDGGHLTHLELQTTNDPEMLQRMAEYAIGIRRREKRYPRQFLLYVGEEPLHMEDRIEEPGMTFWYTLMDVRNLDGDAMARSPRVSDKVLGWGCWRGLEIRRK